jgi:hypothetical protein
MSRSVVDYFPVTLLSSTYNPTYLLEKWGLVVLKRLDCSYAIDLLTLAVKGIQEYTCVAGELCVIWVSGNTGASFSHHAGVFV